MSQRGAVFLRVGTVQIELPDAVVELLPGVRWGQLEAFPSPAYWAYQVLARRLSGQPVGHRLGRTLAEEVAACLLGGHGVPADVGLAAFESLKSHQVLESDPSASDIETILRRPIVVRGRLVHYRFANRKAGFIASAIKALKRADPPLQTGKCLRNWLMGFDGIGYKTASWIARNWLDADDVAILDIHLIRAGFLGGFLCRTLKVPNDYLELEDQFLRFSGALGVRPSELDAVIWAEMMSSPRTVRKLMGTESEGHSSVIPAVRPSDKRHAHAS